MTRLHPGHFERLPLQQSATKVKPSALKFIQTCEKNLNLNCHLNYSILELPPTTQHHHQSCHSLNWFHFWQNLHTWKCQESFKQAQISSASSSSSRALPLHLALSSWSQHIKCSAEVTKWPPITSHTELMRTLSCKTILGTMKQWGDWS